ncbi:MAG: hypothetical protein LIO65_03285 [Odoribacter sp.]|nr:hypothetical protein [Odoribacter sp.]
MKSLYPQFDKIAFLQYDRIDEKLHKSVIKKRRDIEVSIINQKKLFSPERLENNFQDGLTALDIYKETLENIGYKDLIIDFNITKIKEKDISSLFTDLNIDSAKKIIAIAPFSKEETKIYSLDKMEKVVAYFASLSEQYQVIVLGGGIYEKG